MESKEASFFYIFHAPIDKVYSIFCSPTLITCTFFQNAKIISMKRDTSLDDSGNEITINWSGNAIFSFRVDNTVNMPYFKTFRHKSISAPASFCPFDHTFSFFWNSTDKVTVFKFTSFLKDVENKSSITNYIMENKDSMCLSTENYLMKTLTNLEENESISINRSIEEVWTFISDVSNQVYFYPNSQSIKVEKLSEDRIVICDEDSKNRMTFHVQKTEFNNDKKQMELELVEANVSLPKQKIMLNLVRMDDNQCFVIFKHIILEFIPFDILMSYSSQKKKLLRKVKDMIEGGGEK